MNKPKLDPAFEPTYSALPPLPEQAFTFYTNDQAAALLGVSPRMIRRARESGALATTRLGGSRVFHTRQALLDWIDSCTTPAQPKTDGGAA